MIFTAVSLVPVGHFHLLLAPLFCRAGRWAMALGCFVLSTFLTGLLQFFMSYTMALLAFWLLEVSTVIFIVFAFEYIGGRAFVSAEHPAAGAGAGAELHAVSLSPVFSRSAFIWAR